MYSIELLNEMRFGPGRRHKAILAITNLSDETWTSMPRDGGVNLAWWWNYQTQDTNPRRHVFDQLLPGTSVEVECDIQAPRDAGSYTLTFDLVKENHYWFRQKVDHSVRIEVRIPEPHEVRWDDFIDSLRSVNPQPDSTDIIVSHCEINDQHGVGVLLKAIFRQRDNILSIRSRDFYQGRQDFGLVNGRVDLGSETGNELRERVTHAMAQVRPTRILSVPYFAEDVYTTLELKELLDIPLCTYLMDDQNIHAGNIPDRCMAKLLEVSDLRLGISPEMCRAYAAKYGADFQFAPPVVEAALIRMRPARPPVKAAAPAILIGNIWSQLWLEKLKNLTRETRVRIDWYGNPKREWLRFSEPDLLEHGISFKGFRTEEELVEALAAAPFGLVLTGVSDEPEDRPELSRLSLPSRITFMMAVANIPLLVIGGRHTAAARFVENLGLGEVCDWEPNDFLLAVSRIRDPLHQAGYRSRAADLARPLSARDMEHWIWGSLAAGRPIDARFDPLDRFRDGAGPETLFPPSADVADDPPIAPARPIGVRRPSAQSSQPLRVAILSSAEGGGAGVAAGRLAEVLDGHPGFRAELLTAEALGGHLPEQVVPRGGAGNGELTDTFFTIEYPGYRRDWLVERLYGFDMVNVHWTSALISLSEIDRLSRRGKPVLFTLHDFYHITGGCHYPAGCPGMNRGCVDCPQVDATSHDAGVIPANLSTKRRILARENVHLAAPSRFLRDAAIASGIVPSERAHVLRNPYVARAPRGKRAPGRRVRLLLIADRLNERRKGTALAVDSLHELVRRLELEDSGRTVFLEVVGAADDSLAANLVRGRIPHRLLGSITTHQRLVELYGSCDIVLTCSCEDNWPNILVEAGSYTCVPVVGPGHGTEEFVHTYRSGAVATNYTADAFADALLKVMSDLERGVDDQSATERIRADHCAETVVGTFAHIARCMGTYRFNHRHSPGL